MIMNFHDHEYLIFSCQEGKCMSEAEPDFRYVSFDYN